MARRRRQTEQPPALVAAAKRLDTAPPPGSPAIRIPREEWQDDAWDYYDAVPEVKHAARYVGNAMAKIKMFPAIYDPLDLTKPPIPITDERAACPPKVIVAAHAELARLKSNRGGQAEIQRQAAMNLEIAGEGYLTGIAAHTKVEKVGGKEITVPIAEEWEIHSISEIDTKNRQYVVRSSPKEPWVSLGPDDDCIRIWQRHPRWANRPDCALSGLLIECEALHTLALQIIGESNSKRNNGFLLVPNGLTFGSSNVTDTEDGDDPDEDPVMDALAETMQGPIADPSSPSSVQPTLVRGDKEELKEFRHVLASRNSDDIEVRIDGRVQRLARGLDLPVEVVLGHMSTTFANAEQVDQDTFDDYLKPRAELLVDAFTFGFYSPQLAANADVPDEWATRIILWYDPSALITQPDPVSTAPVAHGAKVISDATLRTALGYNEEDAPTEEELLRRTGLDRGAITGDVTLALLKLLGVVINLDESSTVAAGTTPTTATDGTAPPAAAATRHELMAANTPRTNYGAKLLRIDQHLRTRLIVASDAAMSRAMEKAGARLRSKAPKLGVDRQVLRNVDAHDVAATLGPTLVAAAGNVLDGAWDDLESQFRSWAATSQSDALDLASRIVGGLGTADREAAMLRQAGSIDEAWAWMKSALDSLAAAKMFDPSPSAPPIGEFDDTVSIPAGLIRQAMARAGGATGLVTNGRDAWVSVYPDGTPPGMIATGEDVSGVLRDGGAEIDGYAWVYGPAARKQPFDPHVSLDGTEFVNFDDAVLANSEGWPDDAFYFPGDHSGCLCDYEPTVIAPGE